MDIKDIPIQELLDDKAASLADIKVCEFAILHDIQEYIGSSVKKRLNTNKEIVSKIDAELTKRADQRLSVAAESAYCNCIRPPDFATGRVDPFYCRIHHNKMIR